MLTYSMHLCLCNEQDYQFLYDQGVGAIFGPGTRLPAAASETLKAIYKKLEQNKAKGI